MINGTDNADDLWGTSQDDIYNAQKGNDTITDFGGNDTYIFNLGDGQDTIYDWKGTDKIQFGTGISLSDLNFKLVDDNLIISIQNTLDQITIKEWDYSSTYYIETIEFADGTSFDLTTQHFQIVGTDNADNLTGNTKDNIFNAGKGNDTIDGYYSGNDTYIFNLGDGQDTIIDYCWNNTDSTNDIIQFGPGITQNDLEFLMDNNLQNLIIKIKNTTDQITIKDYFLSSFDEIEKIEFSDHTKENLSDLFTISSDFDNSLIFKTKNDVINAQKGNDIITDQGGDDTYIFNLGDGQDTINDLGGTDKIQFGTGISQSDLIFNVLGNDLIITIQNSTDQITINNYKDNNIETIQLSDGSMMNMPSILGTDENDDINGGSGEDVIYAKKGNDNITDQGGNDIYIFNLGDGQDTIKDLDGADKIRFGAGISQADLTFELINNDLIISIQNTLDQITIKDWNTSLDWCTSPYKIETIELNDGSNFDINSVSILINGTDATDNLSGTKQNDTFNAGKGNDIIDGSYGGNDTYIFNLGDGQDTIEDWSWMLSNNTNDVIQFGQGITQTDLEFSTDSNLQDLIIKIKNTTDQITLEDFYLNPFLSIEKTIFSDNTELNLTELSIGEATDNDDRLVRRIESDIIEAKKGNDFITDLGGDDTYIFNLGDGQDTIYDFDGTDKLKFGQGILFSDLNIVLTNDYDLKFFIKNTSDSIQVIDWYGSHQIEAIEFSDNSQQNLTDLKFPCYHLGTDGDNDMCGKSYDSFTGEDIFEAKKGNDEIWDKEGNDTYIFNLGDGQDTICDQDGNDKIIFGPGITLSDLTVKVVDINNYNGLDDLVISIKNTPDQICIRSFYYCYENKNQYKIETLQFYDGSTFDLSQYELTPNSIEKPLISDQNTQVLMLQNLGKTTITDNGGEDIIKFDSSIKKDQITFIRNGEDLNIDYGNGDSVTIKNQWQTENKIEKFQVSDGGYLTANDINQVIDKMTSFAATQDFSINSTEDIKQNQDLMAMICNQWQG